MKIGVTKKREKEEKKMDIKDVEKELRKNRPMETSQEVVTRSEEEVEMIDVKSEFDRISKRRREMSPKKNFDIKVLECRKGIAINPVLKKFREVISKKYPIDKREIEMRKHGWHSIVEGERIFGKDIYKRIKATTLESELKVQVVKDFVKQMTGKEVPEWSNGIEILISNQTNVTSIIIEITFKDVRLIINNQSYNVERVTWQNVSKRVFPVIGKEEKEEVLVFTGMVGKHEETLFRIIKDSQLLMDDRANITYKIIEVNAIRFEIKNVEEIERMYRIRKEGIKRMIEYIEKQGGISGGLRELMYSAELSEKKNCKRKEIEREIGEEGIYIVFNANKRENLRTNKTEIIPKSAYIMIKPIVPI